MPNLVISLAHTARLAKAFAARRHRGKLCSVNLWMALAVPNDVCRWHLADSRDVRSRVRFRMQAEWLVHALGIGAGGIVQKSRSARIAARRRPGFAKRQQSASRRTRVSASPWAEVAACWLLCWRFKVNEVVDAD